MKNKTALLATVGLLEMYYLNYPIELCLLYFNGIIILGTIYKLIINRKKRVESVSLPVKDAEAKDEFQIKFQRKLINLYNRVQNDENLQHLLELPNTDQTVTGTISEIKDEKSIEPELTKLNGLYDQIRIMNKKLDLTK
jgi:hypothetical protein